LAKPSKPTTFPPSSSWDDSEPSYVEGSTKSLYFVDCTVFCDDTFAYSEVSLSSSYEAAKLAYNKATNAQNTANNAQQDIDNLEMGTRNLLLHSKELTGANITTHAGITLTETYNDLAVCSYDNSANTSSYIDVLRFENLYPEKLGDEYTLSFYAKGTGNMVTYFNGASGYLQVNGVAQSNGGSSTAGDGYSQWSLTNEWQRYWVTWTLSNSGDISIEKYVLFRANAKSVVSICGPKLEKGNRATDWTPAPEDMATSEEVNNAQSSADAANDAADDLKVKLTGAISRIDSVEGKIITIATDENGTTSLVQSGSGLTLEITDATDVNNKLSDINNKVGNLNTAVESLQTDTKYITTGTYTNPDGTTEPSIELYTANSKLKVLITNTKIVFVEDGSTPTYINTEQGLVTEHITITGDVTKDGPTNEGELRHGNFVWKQRSNGNYGLQYRGGN
jgi:hypothetical protein